jgi:hypothetical protein
MSQSQSTCTPDILRSFPLFFSPSKQMSPLFLQLGHARLLRIVSSVVCRHNFACIVQDCDGDGQVDCQDYARIHRMGVADCGKQPGDDFYEFKNDIDACLAEISSSTQDTN